MTIKERPIVFDAESVRAILAGRKTQTRRVIKPQPAAGVRASPFVASGIEDGHGRELRCPHGAPGDKLWVRETWGFSAQISHPGGVCGERAKAIWALSGLSGYRADNPPGNWCWRSPIHMPRWASRLTLEITDIRATQIQNMTTEDALAEGIVWSPGQRSAPILDFVVAWNVINEKRGYRWMPGLWVWAITFRRVQP